MTTDEQRHEAYDAVAVTIVQAIAGNAPVDLMNDKRFQQYARIWGNAARNAVLAQPGDLAAATGLAQPEEVLREASSHLHDTDKTRTTGCPGCELNYQADELEAARESDTEEEH